MESNYNVGLCSSVVLDLMDGLEGYEVYTDNYYISPVVYMTFYGDNSNASGTARTNRTGFPKSMVRRARENRGYYNYLSNGPFLVAAWYDRRFVYFLSTFHGGASHGETVRWTNPDGSSSNVPCPPIFPYYQQYMRGVDHSDKHLWPDFWKSPIWSRLKQLEFSMALLIPETTFKNISKLYL